MKVDRFTTSFQDESLLFLFSYWIDLARPSLVTLLNISSTSKQVCLNSKNCLVLHMRLLMKISKIYSLLCSLRRPSKYFYIIYNYINLRMPLWVSVWVTVLSWLEEVLTSKENGLGLFLTEPWLPSPLSVTVAQRNALIHTNMIKVQPTL